MQAIVGLSRGLSRAFVNGVVSRSQNSAEASSGTEAEQKLGEDRIKLQLCFDFILLTLLHDTDMSREVSPSSRNLATKLIHQLSFSVS